MKKFKENEWLNVIPTENGGYCAFPTNLPQVIVQGKTYEEVVENAKTASITYLTYMLESINRENPFTVLIHADARSWLLTG
jgi:predicted RNase H-like HicB family nuclease